VELQICLATLDIDKLITNLEDFDAYALCMWPRGLELLITSSSAQEVDALTVLLWELALVAKSSQSLLLLQPYKTCVDLDEWRSACGLWSQRSNEYADMIEQARRSQVLDALADRFFKSLSLYLPETGVSDNMVESSYVYDWVRSVLAAESAWKAGFRDLNSIHPALSHTPLWKHSIPVLSWRVLEWLLSHGADPTWTHPTLLTTPGHNVARWAAKEGAPTSIITNLGCMSDLVVSKQRDNCTCHCSRGGCSIIGCTVSKMNITDHRRMHHHEKTQPHFFALVDDNRTAAWMSSAIFRILTFEKLSLTHTCCYRIFVEFYGCVTRPTPEEAQVIYELESDDINLLDNLVAEFEVKWAKNTRPFVTFMNRVWRPRMQAIRREREIDQETYQSELVRMGVTLENSKKEHNSEFDSDVDWPDDYESEGDGWYTTDEEDVHEE
jgi:hypothetical protein